jgi:hypothetical protein
VKTLTLYRPLGSYMTTATLDLLMTIRSGNRCSGGASPGSSSPLSDQ